MGDLGRSRSLAGEGQLILPIHTLDSIRRRRRYIKDGRGRLHAHRRRALDPITGRTGPWS
jgi:hypothetical protein